VGERGWSRDVLCVMCDMVGEGEGQVQGEGEGISTLRW
jgi:hypothetical protein